MNVTFLPGSIKSAFLVLIQFICIGIIAFTGKVIPENLFLLLALIFSLILAVWSMIVMKFHFNAAPDVLPGAKLTIKGPYKLIRHPMYTSLLLLILVWIINDFTFVRLTISIIFFIDLILKIFYEEKLLSKNFKEYSKYKKRTKRIIPYIY
ncbi:MAG: methyltransferase [Ignavibacteria bacterium]|jgi:protein-S-isoprenylcysteine O-methyltransferase Ste14